MDAHFWIGVAVGATVMLILAVVFFWWIKDQVPPPNW